MFFCAFISLIFPTIYFSLMVDDESIVIKNDMYRIEVPSTWKPIVTENTDGYVPGKRKILDSYDLYYLQWNSLICGLEDIPKSISLTIESYVRIDGRDISLYEIERLEQLKQGESVCVLSKESICETPGKKIMRTIINSEDSDGSWRKYCNVILFKKNNQVVHVVNIGTRESNYDSLDIQKVIDAILKSFTVKNDI